ncbi:class I SAM-dependent methyltransferase [Virgibacillus senegalensis]|uniref:class I SAM-dependent methyltransferase n=1 Tax=Virgibacillus senegalensis TaxID=1499679 RepID=UPI00069EB934|nr:class I SAM-dependent methyltransferase [Virgibacillus senegalensis]
MEDKTFDWHQAAGKQWDGRASFWNQNSKAMWDEGSRKEIIPFFDRYLDAGASVLDVGCGDGYGSYKLMRAGYNVIGMDLSVEMIAKAEQLVDGNQLSFVQGDIVHLSFADERFDGIMGINVLEWAENPLHALQELDRVLKTGGKVCIGLLGPTAGPRNNSYPRLYGEKVICNTMMPWELKRLVEEEIGWKTTGGKPVYKKGVSEKEATSLPEELQQALSFMWLFLFQKE